MDFPGISDIVIQQQQHSSNPIHRSLGKINVEPKTDISYRTPANPLDKIDKTFKITFRMNQGLYNYFMIYETIFYQTCKQLNGSHYPVFYIEILNELGQIVSKIFFKDILIDGIDGLSFNYSKIERDAGTFDVTFKFNNLDFEFIDTTYNEDESYLLTLKEQAELENKK